MQSNDHGPPAATMTGSAASTAIPATAMNAVPGMAMLSGEAAANDAPAPKNRLEAMLAARGGALSTILYRAVILAEVGPNVNRQDISTYYTRWVKRAGQAAAASAAESVGPGGYGAMAIAPGGGISSAPVLTGMLLLMPTYALMVLEGPRVEIYACLRDMARQPPAPAAPPAGASDAAGADGPDAPIASPGSTSPAPPPPPLPSDPLDPDASDTPGIAPPVYLTHARVLVMQDDLPARAFPYWLSRVVAATGRDAVLPPPPAGTPARPLETVRAVTAVTSAAVQFGRVLAAAPKNDVKGLLDAQFATTGAGTAAGKPVAGLPPGAGVVADLFTAGWPVREWLNMWDGAVPYAAARAADDAWPMPTWSYVPAIRALTAAMEGKEGGSGGGGRAGGPGEMIGGAGGGVVGGAGSQSNLPVGAVGAAAV
ncbi:hypothetical protein GGF31_004590 [Allomyces arbusculus]|nr:hypothetical protein GGF31_004590 [Allomyces arbusculus]